MTNNGHEGAESRGFTLDKLHTLYRETRLWRWRAGDLVNRLAATVGYMNAYREAAKIFGVTWRRAMEWAAVASAWSESGRDPKVDWTIYRAVYYNQIEDRRGRRKLTADEKQVAETLRAQMNARKDGRRLVQIP